MDRVSVSVVIPAYNAARYVEQALDSVVQQTIGVNQIVVIDDGSTDDTRNVVLRYSSRVQLVSTPNLGAPSARNHGIRLSGSDWIAFLDADDYWMSDKLAIQLDGLQSSLAVASHTDHYAVSETGHQELVSHNTVSSQVRYSYPYLLHHSPMLTSTLMIRNGLNIYYPEWADSLDDTLFNFSLVSLGSIDYVAKPLACYRRHSANMTNGMDYAMRGYACLSRWLFENSSIVSADMAFEAKESLVSCIVNNADRARWHRNWELYDRHIAFLQAQHSSVLAKAYLSRLRFPRWLYTFRDYLLGR